MSTCVPTPTLTEFSAVVQDTITTTYSLTTSTPPAVVTTHVDSYCQNEAVVLGSTICLRTGARTRVETVQPTGVVYSIPYEITNQETAQVAINTLYGGCSDTPTDPDGNGSNPGSSGGSDQTGYSTDPASNGNNAGTISVPPGQTLITSSVLVYTTDVPFTTLVPSVVTLPDGRVTTTSVLTVITPTPSQVYVATTALVEATGNSQPGSQKYGNLGVIVGAVIGGFIGLCLMILAWWCVRRRRKTAYDEILYEHEKQIEDHEARQQAIERSKDPNRKRDSDPKPSPYCYGSLLSGRGRIQSSTSTGVALSQNPFEGASVGTRATYMAPGSPLLPTPSTMGEFGAGSGSSVVTDVYAGVSEVGGRDGATDSTDSSASSTFGTSRTVSMMSSAPTLDSSSCESRDPNYLQPYLGDEFVEVEIGGVGTGVVRGSRVISPPPHLSMSFGSWNTNTSRGRDSGGTKRSSGVNPEMDPYRGSSEGSHGSEEEEGQLHLLCPQKPQRFSVQNHATTRRTETAREDSRGHLRKRSGSPVSWTPPVRGPLFIVNQRNSEDL